MRNSTDAIASNYTYESTAQGKYDLNKTKQTKKFFFKDVSLSVHYLS